MPDTREKMTKGEAISILSTVLKQTVIDVDYAYDTTDGKVELVPGQKIADALTMAIAALIEQEERRWIPVTERLPKLVTCGAGTAYSEAVNVLTSGRKVLTAIWDGTDFIADAEFWEAEGEEITHWTPVLLPLPEPPKGE